MSFSKKLTVTLFGGEQRDSVYFLILYFIFYIFMGVPGNSGGVLGGGGFRGFLGGSGFYRHPFILHSYNFTKINT